MKYLIKTILILFLSSTISAMPMSEMEKINYLLNKVENSQLFFIRNGIEHSPKKARNHLEMKYKRAGDRIKTAEQFIKYIATKSSFSGKYYYIKLKNGKKIKASVWFKNILKGLIDK